MADFSGLVGKVFLATQASRGSVVGVGGGFYKYTEANTLADQSDIVSTYGADATITFLTAVPPNANNNFYTFSAKITSSNFFVNNQTISGTFLANGATDFVLNAQGVPGVGSAFLYFTNTVAQQPGPGNSVNVADVLNNVTYTAPACFAKGTLIDTSRGPVAVELLVVGDQVVIHDDHEGDIGRTRSIVWIGHRTLNCARHPSPADVLPVRVRAGAFCAGVPRRDLYLSPDHAIYTDGVLIPIKYLMTRDTVTQVLVEDVTYYHIELSSHDIVVAEGLPVESYLDSGDRTNFDNGGRTTRLFPDFSHGHGTQVSWEVLACAPFRVIGPEVEAVRARLNERAARPDAEGPCLPVANNIARAG